MLKNLLTLILVFLICSECSFAACEKDVQRIKTGTSSPCDGWLVNDPQMQEFAKNADEVEATKKLIKAQDLVIKLDGAEIEHYKQKSERTQKRLEQTETRSFWLAAGAFALGVVITGVAAKAAIESTR